MTTRLHPDLITKLIMEFAASLQTDVEEEIYPFLKRCLFLKNKMIYMKKGFIFEKNGVHFKYMNTEYNEKISAIHIATAWTGRILSYSHSTKTWFNVYDNSFNPDVTFTEKFYKVNSTIFLSWEDALNNRKYQLDNGEYLMDNKFMESPFLIDHIIATLTELDK